MNKEYKKTAAELMFEKEIGVSLSSAIASLCKGGISVENLVDITDKTKVVLSEEIEKRNIPMEYRFLLLNIVLCALFDMSLIYHKRFINSLNREMIESGELDIELFKEK